MQIFSKSLITFTAILVSVCCATAGEILDVKVSGSAVFDSGRKQCLIGIVNGSNSRTIQKLRVTLLNVGASQFQVGPVDMVPAQALVLGHDITSGTVCSGSGVVFRVSFEEQGIKNEMLVVDSLKESSSSAHPWNTDQAVGALFGLITALIAGWTGHFWTISVEREKARMSRASEQERDRITRATERFKTIEPAFRQFLLDWSASIDAPTLQARFQPLRAAFSLDARIVAAYRQTYSVLNDPAALNEAKEAASAEFEQKISLYLQQINPMG
jgi:hypothetical protein